MRPSFSCVLSATLLAVVLGTGCAAPSDGAPSGDETASSDLTGQLSDAALQGKLRGILKDVSFTSESDFPYLVFEGDAVAEKRLSTKLVRQKLQAAIKAQSSSHRDILPSSCRSSRLVVHQAIADGNAAVVPANHDDDEFVSAFHDKQVSIALKVMLSQLRSVVGYTFGTNASGDQDDVGPVLFVYVGISKTTGKLIAIMTEAVFT